MKKLSKTKILILIILLTAVSFHIYRVYFYEDKRWSRMPDLIQKPGIINGIENEKTK
ncbi:MAG: hypothetical protein PHI37_05375 [Candidatus Gracilibacteria bacterium]|nr:hypothetical protein [Candidatus Gracilibacteria bacterium]